MIRNRPARLDLTFPRFPLYFVTFCTRNRAKLSSLTRAQDTLKAYATRGELDSNIAVGRYVIMPDHLHLFVQGEDGFVLSKWVGGLKRALSVALEGGRDHPLWQPGFFDHVLRNDESYAQKWEYVRDNPMRAGLVSQWDDWPYQGEIVALDRA
jgi:REP element-mobilizing transposase RayT